MKKLKQYLFNPMTEGLGIVDKELKEVTNGADIPLGCSMYRTYDRWEFTAETLSNIPSDILWRTLISCEAKIRIHNNIIDCTSANKNTILYDKDIVICTYYIEATQVMFELLSSYNVSLPNHKDGEQISNLVCTPKDKIHFLKFDSPRIVNGKRYETGVIIEANNTLTVITEAQFDECYDIVIGG